MRPQWTIYKLGDISSIKGGKRLPKGSTIVEIPTTHPYIRVVDMKLRKIDKSSLLYVQEDVFRKISRYIVNDGDVILSIVGTIGSVALIDKALDKASLTENCVKLTDFNKLDPSFLYYFLISKLGQEEIAKGVVGSTQPKLPLYNIQNIRINCPPLPEQRAIASILSALDDKIELNLQINKTLEDMAMTLYKHWFVDFGPFRSGEFVSSELGEIPKGWEVWNIKDIIELNPRITLSKGREAPFVDMKALPIDKMSVSEIEMKTFNGGSKFQNGDTLFARITPCLENGKTAFVDFLDKSTVGFGSTEFLVMRSKREAAKFWVYCLSRDSSFRKFAVSTMVGTSGRQRVQSDHLLTFKISIPPIQVFKDFSIIVESWFSQIRLNTIENQTLTTLRDTLLPKLISGEVRVKDAALKVAEAL